MHRPIPKPIKLGLQQGCAYTTPVRAGARVPCREVCTSALFSSFEVYLIRLFPPFSTVDTRTVLKSVLTVYSRTDAYTCVSARVDVPSTALDRAPLQLLAVGLTLFFSNFKCLQIIVGSRFKKNARQQFREQIGPTSGRALNARF